jgi:O-antigen/teichoic acid export membrane protein
VLVIGAATGGVAAIGLAILVASGLAEGYLPRLGLDQLPAWMAFCLAVGLGAAHLAVELAAQRHRRYQATAAAIPLLALAVLGALAAAGRLDAERAILAFMAGWLVPVAALVWRGPSPLRATREAIRQAVVFARPYLLPSLLAPTVGTLGVLAVRQAVAGSASPHDLGLWQALWRVAEAVMGLLASILSALLIPRLSRLTTRAEAGRAIQRACLAGVLLYLPVALAWLVVPRLALRLLLAPAFLGVEALLPLQVVGDLLKVVATVLVLACTALLRPGLTLLAEVVFSAAFAGLALLLTPGGGPLGAVGAYVGAYAVLLAVLLPLVVRLVRSLPVAAPS